MTTIQVIEAVGIGLAAGVVGGLAGIGGSLVMLPGLALVFGYDDEKHSAHHVYMAAAMVINVLVAIPATRKHAQAGAVRRELVARILPTMIVAIVAGVLASDRVPGLRLKQLLAVFIAAYCVLNIYRIFKPRPQVNRPAERTGPVLLATLGGAAGLLGGLLGLGGGAVMVPALQVFARVKLIDAIATSSATMVGSAAIGASLKLATLSTHDRSWREALLLVVAMAPGAILGGSLGATLAHRLPIKAVRLVISIILLLVAARMAY